MNFTGKHTEIRSEALEALQNIAIKFDELGFVPTTLTTEEKHHFAEWFLHEYSVIKLALEQAAISKKGLISVPTLTEKALEEFLETLKEPGTIMVDHSNTQALEIIKMIEKGVGCDICDAKWHKGCMCVSKKLIKKIKERYGIE